jgi:glycosyltransferase 2 family protein
LKNTIIKALRFIAFLALGLVMLYFAFRGMDFSEMKGIFQDTKFAWIILSMVISVLALVSRARRWMLIIHALNYNPSLWNTFNAVVFGYLANYAFPRLGEVSKCVALGRKEKIPVDSLVGTIIVERALDLLMAVLIMVFLLIARFEKFGTFFQEFLFNPMGDKISSGFSGAWLIILVIGILGILTVVLLYIYRNRLYKFKFFKKFSEIVKGIIVGIRTVMRLERKWEFLFHTLFIWLCYALMTWVVVFALPGITDSLTFVDGIFLLVVGSMGMVVPVQAGIGAFHWIVSRGLHFVYGLELTEGLVFATLQHESQTLLILVLGSISMFFIFRKTRIKDKPAYPTTSETS